MHVIRSVSSVRGAMSIVCPLMLKRLMQLCNLCIFEKDAKTCSSAISVIFFSFIPLLIMVADTIHLKGHAPLHPTYTILGQEIGE